MSETDLTIVVAVLSLAMSITAIVITLTKKPSKGTVSEQDTENLNNKLNELHERVNVLENLLKGELKVTLHEMMGRIDQLNEAVFKQK